MCNRYAQTIEAVELMAWSGASLATNQPLTIPDIFPDYEAPVVRLIDGERVINTARWGLPSPAFALVGKSRDPGVTNVRNTKSSHWRRWLGPEHRCLVPWTKFCEPDQASGSKKPVWFFLPDHPVAFFAGIYVPGWPSTRKVKEGPVIADLYGFLTTDPNAEVAQYHPKAMPVILTDPAEIETWLRADWSEAAALQKPFLDCKLNYIA